MRLASWAVEDFETVAQSVQRVHDGGYVMVTVGTLGGDVEAKVDFAVRKQYHLWCRLVLCAKVTINVQNR